MNMKKLLLSIFALVGVASMNAQTTTVLWEDATGVEVSWDMICNKSASECAGFKVGDELLITVSACDPTKNDYPQVVLKFVSEDGTTWKDLWNDGVSYTHITKDREYPYVITIPLTETLVETMKENGFFVSGIASTCTKVEHKTKTEYAEAEEFVEKALSAEVVSGLNPEDKLTVVYDIEQTAGDISCFIGWGMANVVVNMDGWPKIEGAALNMQAIGENKVTFKASTLLAAEGATEFGFNINIWGQSNDDATATCNFVKWIIERAVVTEDTPNAIEEVAPVADVVKVTYTSLTGAVSSEPVKGVNIKTVFYSDGSKEVSKIVVR